MAAVLPGVREFRTPFVAGCLWTAVVLVFVQAFAPSAFSEWRLVSELGEIVKHLPGAATLGVLAFAIYLFGVFATSLSAFSTNFGYRAFWRRTGKPHKRSHSDVDLLGATYLRDAVREQLSSYPVVVREVALNLVLAEYRIADVSLASKSAEQFQEYDRVRSEAEFRRVAWLPISILAVGLSLLAPSYGSFAATLVGLLIGAVLYLQARQKQNEANDRLASAIYFGLATTPLFDSLVRELLEKSAAAANGKGVIGMADHHAWLIDFLVIRELWREMPRVMARVEDEEMLTASLDRVAPAVWRVLVRREDLTHFLAVAYANLEAITEGIGKAGNADELRGFLSPREVVESVRRIDKFLSVEVEIGNIAAGEIEQRGVLAAIGQKKQSELQGGLSDTSWRVASEILDGWRDAHRL
ncbi:hypothetical protein ACFQ8E_02865 [Isoptericola sp. NPDC056573]|uniref:hypothetical protein n=1 Tax=Isoptericola sp. NPDC056573 TaxID=3345868 RepID=UPI00368B71C7